MSQKHIPKCVTDLHRIEDLPQNPIFFPGVFGTHQLLLGPFDGGARSGVESDRIEKHGLLMIAHQVDTEVFAHEQAFTGIRTVADDVTQPDDLLDPLGGTIFKYRSHRGEIGVNIADDCRLQLRPPDPGYTSGRESLGPSRTASGN